MNHKLKYQYFKELLDCSITNGIVLVKKEIAAFNKTLQINIKNDSGLGAKLEWCLEIFAYCNENNLTPSLKFSNSDKKSKDDYFSPFFGIKSNSKIKTTNFITIQSILDLKLSKDYDKTMTLEFAVMLINKYLRINNEILFEVDSFSQKYFSNHQVLGLHYRGTDKTDEAPLVPYDKVLRNINLFLFKHPLTSAVFVSTDDQHFLNYLTNNFNSIPIIYRQDYFRSEDSKAIHHSREVNKYEVYRDAIVNCLILARCSALLKTASILSDWSKLFNPSLPIIYLNKPYERCLYFPARELIKTSLYESID